MWRVCDYNWLLLPSICVVHHSHSTLFPVERVKLVRRWVVETQRNPGKSRVPVHCSFRRVVQLLGFEPRLLGSEPNDSASWSIIAEIGGAEGNRTLIETLQMSHPTVERRPRKLVRMIGFEPT